MFGLSSLRYRCCILFCLSLIWTCASASSLHPSVHIDIDVEVDATSSIRSSAAHSLDVLSSSPSFTPDIPWKPPFSNPFGHNRNALFIFVDFDDCPSTYSINDMEELFITSAYGVPSYFNKASYGNLQYSMRHSHVVGVGPPAGPWTSPLRMPHPKSFYANGYHGWNLFPPQQSLIGLAADALSMLDTQWGGDFSHWADENGRVDSVFVIFSGHVYAETDGAYERGGVGQTNLLPTSLDVSILFPTSSNGHTFGMTTFCEELDDKGRGKATVNRCIHEHGHAFHLVDLYDFSYKDTGGVGDFDLMATGVFAYPNHPTDMGAYSKYQLGWIRPRDIAAYSDPQTVRMRSVESFPEAVRLSPNNEFSSLEYFLLENRGVTGLDQYLTFSFSPCRGMLVWHIDEAIGSLTHGGEIYLSNRINTISTDPSLCYTPGICPSDHRGVVVVEADGSNSLQTGSIISEGGCSSMFMPSGVAQLNTEMTTLYSGEQSGISVQVEDICANGDIVIQIAGSQQTPDGVQLLSEYC